MTIGGWIIMIVSVSVVTIAFIWSVVRVMRSADEKHMVHGLGMDPNAEDALHEAHQKTKRKNNG